MWRGKYGSSEAIEEELRLCGRIRGGGWRKNREVDICIMPEDMAMGIALMLLLQRQESKREFNNQCRQ